MAKETYELISNDDRAENDALATTYQRRGLSYTSRLGALLLLVIFSIMFTLVAIKISEKEVQDQLAEEKIQEIGRFTIVWSPKEDTPLVTTQITTPKPTYPKTTTPIPQSSSSSSWAPTAPFTSTVQMITNGTMVKFLSENVSSIGTPPPATIKLTDISDTNITSTTPLPSNKKRRSVQNPPPPTDSKKKKTSDTKSSSPLYRESTRVCTSVACKTTASTMLSLMDSSVDPCDDFYQFACGGITENVAKDANVWKTIMERLSEVDEKSPTFLQKHKTFFDSCLLHERLFNYQTRVGTVSKLVQEAGKLATEANEAEVDLIKLISKLFLRRSMRFVDLSIGTDSKTTNFLMKLSLPNQKSVLRESGPWLDLSNDQLRCLAEQNKDMQTKDVDLNKIHNAYTECQNKHTVYLNSVEDVLRALNLVPGDKASQVQQIQDIQETIKTAFLKNLNEVPIVNELEHKFETQKISKLQESYNFLEWTKLVERLTGHTVDDTLVVQIHSYEYITKVLSSLKALPKWKINNALLAIHAQDLYENLVIPQAKHTRDAYCLRLSANVFPDVLSNIYMKTWFDSDIEHYQKLAQNIFNQLKTNLAADIEKSEWADISSKTSMLSKLKDDATLLLNKKEDLFNNEEILKTKYENVLLNVSNFIENAVTMLEVSRKSFYGLQGKPFDVKLVWSNFVNAFDAVPKSFYTNGLIAAPIGILKQPKEEYPGYLSMAQIGLSLAKELARQFDLIGIDHGTTLSESAKKSFLNFKNIMEDQSLFTNSRTVKKHELKYQVKPQLSSNKRIVDNTAVKITTESLHSLGEESVLPWVSSTYNIEQVFFIAVAQDYCKDVDIPEFMKDVYDSETLPPALQVRNIITNSGAFQKVFECSNESAMNKISNKLQFPAV